MSRKSFKIARRKKSRLIYFLFIPVTLILCVALIYTYIIKDNFFKQETDDSPELTMWEEEVLPEMEDTDAKKDVPEVPADLAERVTDDLEENDHSFGDAEPDARDQELVVIEDGNDLLAPVNKKTTLRADYEPEDLKAIPEYMNPDRSMMLRELALRKLVALWHTAEFDGIILKVVSAFRSYDYQKDLFQRYSDNYGPEEANRFSARAGQSEHQLGTTVDFGGTAHDLNSAFAETDQGLWLADNAHLFGFVMSYPADSEDITGYIYEPWHFRYIGVEAALDFKKSGLTLTEYLNRKYDWPD